MAESIVAGLITVGIQVILAISVNIISGYARQLSLGQAAFAGLGAYASALLNVRLGYSFWIACPLSVFLTGGVGLLLGLPCLRGAKHYILVMTLGTNFLLQHLLLDGRFMGGYLGLGSYSSSTVLCNHVAVVGVSAAHFPLHRGMSSDRPLVLVLPFRAGMASGSRTADGDCWGGGTACRVDSLCDEHSHGGTRWQFVCTF